ncbi:MULTISPECIES: ABC transporter permease [unclassified Saccharopolyspora]|uniref:ABC transporter permease n=1 Tax=unclassified Saccharopolyspora TaxID=2646250 RepID=UPI001CD44781|nr:MULTISPECIES: ABC transporter permease [unclassified Saccharopolyspora]MCA1189395.1 ABC transporter permease [Saccharopolyspora sp. 6T]MCA1191234.1 ABC transporter permease [Saccharopolyspora sp. 6V]MCA1228681.1 ABC transporter permease [Saccharopolyspora sp. 6M]MCA1282651.1 ABC transporter permease [Saccharopolyspora sp. 7B]
MSEQTRQEVAPGAPDPVPGRSRRQRVETLFRFQSFFGLVAVFLAAIVLSPRGDDGQILFLTGDNLFNIVRAVSEIGIIAVGLTFVILIGGIDLSVGSVLGLAAVGSAVLLVNDDFGVLVAALLVLLIGLVFGVLQGAAVAVLGVQAFIVTLAGLNIARGLARMWSGGETVQISYGDGAGQAPMLFSLLGERTFGGVVPIPALIFAVVAVAAILFLRYSAYSRHLYAIGGNEKAARLSGVPVNRVKIIAFALSGFCAALAGIVHAGQLNAGSPNDGLAYELDGIAAVVVGGTSLAGGRGSVVGTIAGALLLGILNNILSLNSVNTDMQLLIKGLVIVAAAALQRLRPAA